MKTFDFELLMQSYLHHHPNENQVVQDFIEFYQSSAQAFERSHLVGHFTASAMLVHPQGEAGLMTHHKKLNRWLQLGGHADGIQDLYQVALQEAHEESGIEGIQLLSTEILDIDVHEIPARPDEPAHLHWDLRFLMQAPQEEFQVSEESHNLAWVPFNDPRWLQEDSLRRLMEKSKAQLTK